MTADERPAEQTIQRVDDGEWLGEDGLVYVPKEDVTPVIGKAMALAFTLGIGVGVLLATVIGGGIVL